MEIDGCCRLASQLTNSLLQLNIAINFVEDKHGKKPELTQLKESIFFIIFKANELFTTKNIDECVETSEIILGKIMKLYDKLEKIAPRDEIIGELKAKQMQINIHIHDLVKDSGVSKVYIDQKIETNINIKIEIDLPTIQSEFVKFKREVAKLDVDLKEELEDLENDILEVTPKSEQSAINKAMNKLSTFMQELNDEDSKFNKIVKGSKKGIEYAQKLGKTYNRFAQWLALPQVPDLFLEK